MQDVWLLLLRGLVGGTFDTPLTYQEMSKLVLWRADSRRAAGFIPAVFTPPG